MAGTKKPKYDGHFIRDISEKLRGLQPGNPLDQVVSRDQMLAGLAEVVAETLAKGVSLDQIQQTLRNDGVVVGKDRLRRLAPEPKSKPPARKAKPVEPETVQTEPKPRPPFPGSLGKGPADGTPRSSAQS